MRVLFFGDIVGPDGVGHIAARLTGWRAANGIDLVIANAENAAVGDAPDPARGFGITPELAQQLRAAGVDVITGGNHSWDAGSEAFADSRVLRPHNVPGEFPGSGLCVVEVAGMEIAVLNLIGPTALGSLARAENPLAVYERARARHPAATFIVDFHADWVIEKHAFAHAVDGEVAAVLGTHVHEPSLRLRTLPRHTLFVAEVGMTGRRDGIVGIGADYFVAGTRKAERPAWTLADGDIEVGAVIFEIDERGRGRWIERFMPED